MKIILLLAMVVTTTLGAEESPLLKYFTVNNNQFTSEIYKELQKSNSGNFLVCPLSLETVLTLVQSGAEGKTAQELSDGLHLPKSSEEIQETYRVLSRRIQSTPYYNLTSANKIYVRDGIKINDQFKDTATNVFDAEIQNLDFGKKEEAAGEINNWIQAKTHGTIKNAIDKDALDDVVAVLINAMYFRGKWASPFQKKDTQKKAFWVNNQHQVETDMMEQTGTFQYRESSELNAKFLKLTYAGDRDFINLVIALPNDKEGLHALEARIADVFAAQDDYHQDVHVVLPKFTIESTIELKSILQNLGIVDVFENSANLRGIFDRPVKISKVFQKAFIEVDEEGTTASAATVVLPQPVSAFYEPPPPEQFIADHPFIFYLTVKDVVLFAGRYSSPVTN